jgi:hypothetical protein
MDAEQCNGHPCGKHHGDKLAQFIESHDVITSVLPKIFQHCFRFTTNPSAEKELPGGQAAGQRLDQLTN